MEPISPVMPGVDLPETVIAKDQPEYMPLPSYITEDGQVITRWKLSEEERERVYKSGDLWLTILTFGTNIQPVRLDTKCPLRVVEDAPCQSQII